MGPSINSTKGTNPEIGQYTKDGYKYQASKQKNGHITVSITKPDGSDGGILDFAKDKIKDKTTGKDFLSTYLGTRTGPDVYSVGHDAGVAAKEVELGIDCKKDKDGKLIMTKDQNEAWENMGISIGR